MGIGRVVVDCGVSAVDGEGGGGICLPVDAVRGPDTCYGRLFLDMASDSGMLALLVLMATWSRVLTSLLISSGDNFPLSTMPKGV